MRVWLDNTGMHGAGRCLEGRARSEIDLSSFLQLCVLVAFSDELQFNSFETDDVVERTDRYVQQFRQSGVSSGILHSADGTEHSYGLACKTAAELAVVDLPEASLPGPHDLRGLAPELPRGDSLHGGFSELAVQDLSVEDLEGVTESALTQKAAGAINYMIAADDVLRFEVARKMSQAGGWTDAHAHQLGAFLRYYLNDALAEQNYSFYAPAIGRARLVQRTTLYLLERLSDLVDDLAGDLSGVSLQLPAFHIALIVMGKGEPQAVVEASVTLRERTNYIRTWLAASLNKKESESSGFYADALAQENAIRTSILETLNMTDAPLPAATIDTKRFVGTPSPSADPVALAKWVQHWQRRRRFSVLTEMCAQAALEPDRHKYVKRFRQRCYRNREN